MIVPGILAIAAVLIIPCAALVLVQIVTERVILGRDRRRVAAREHNHRQRILDQRIRAAYATGQWSPSWEAIMREEHR